MPSHKRKIFSLAIVILILLIFFLYRAVFYTPLLLEQGKRNPLETVIDFLYYSWHFTKASIFDNYLHKKEAAEKELEKSGFYSKSFFARKYGLDADDSLGIIKVYGEKIIAIEKWKPAVEAFSKAVAQDKNDHLSHYYLGLSYLGLNKTERAKRAFQAVLNLAPDFADAYYRLGTIAEKEQKREEAKSLYEKTVAILPNHLDALRALARTTTDIH